MSKKVVLNKLYQFDKCLLQIVMVLPRSQELGVRINRFDVLFYIVNHIFSQIQIKRQNILIVLIIRNILFSCLVLEFWKDRGKKITEKLRYKSSPFMEKKEKKSF